MVANEHTTAECTLGKRVRVQAGVVISNTPLGKGHMPYADKLDEGVLGVYVTTARGLLQLARV